MQVFGGLSRSQPGRRLLSIDPYPNSCHFGLFLIILHVGLLDLSPKQHVCKKKIKSNELYYKVVLTTQGLLFFLTGLDSILNIGSHALVLVGPSSSELFLQVVVDMGSIGRGSSQRARHLRARPR